MSREEAKRGSLPSLLDSLFAIVASGLTLAINDFEREKMNNDNFKELASGDGDGLILARGNTGKGLNNSAQPETRAAE